MTICVRPNGSEFYVAGSCPAGTTAKAPASTGQSTGQSGGQTTAPATTPTTTRPPLPTGPWMPRPVPLGSWENGNQTPNGAPPRVPVAYIEATMDPNSGLNSGVTTMASANSQYMNYPETHWLFEAIATSLGGRSGQVQYQNFVQQSADLQAAGIYRTPFQLAMDYANRAGLLNGAQPDPPGGGGRSYGGGGGSVGPMPVDQSAAKRMMDSLATSLLGRTLSEDEFKDYYADYSRRFAGNPAMDSQQDASEALQTQEDYQEYQVAGKFAQAMQSVIKGAM